MPPSKPRNTAALPATDVILPMSEPYRSLILSGRKTYEFWRYRLKLTVRQIWFYRTAPYSAITHIAEIASAHAGSTEGPLPDENGVGNKDCNDPKQIKQWRRRYGEYAYKILAIWELRERIPLAVMRERYGIKGPPRGFLYVPARLRKEFVLDRQRRLLHAEECDGGC